MIVTYRREMKHNYLIIEQDNAQMQRYEENMLKENKISGLLKFQLKQIDNRKYFYYEITSKQPLSRILEFHSINKQELINLSTGIAQILNRLPAYLLKEDQILLQPEYIYIEPEQFFVSLCLIPGRDRKFSAEMSELLRYLLGKINHQDKECVVMAYALYQESVKDNYGMDALAELVSLHNDKLEARQEEEECETQSGFTNTEKVEIQVIEEFSSPAQNKTTGFGLWKPLIISSVVVTGFSAVLWSVAGYKGILRYWYLVMAAGVLSVLFGFKLTGRNQCQHPVEDSPPKDRSYDSEQEEWQTAFYESKEESSVLLKSTAGEESLQTVLLTNSQKDMQVRVFKSASTGIGDIIITYTPYLIGKQEGLVDYVLNGEAISRIHVKIEKEENDYFISDLNSTNGTYVNGRLLETNETVLLNTGDEIFIANFAFIFT
ncbi:MAG: FHA domain-containing protein [Hungatella sp.]|nr:FHA domain-containing protein [Hungatella sp.]